MHARRHLLIAALVAATVTALWLVIRPSPGRAPSPPVVITKPPPEKAAAPATVNPPAVAGPPPAAEPSPTSHVAAANEAEQISTDRMIAAHAALRSPEVADPDSVQNRRILQVMVAKALRASGPGVLPPPPAN